MKGHRNLSAFCGWVNNVIRKWEQDGATDIKPLELERRRARHDVSLLWMQRSTKTRYCERIPVNVPSHLEVDRLVMNLFHGVE
jgi:hypothetical protein